MSTRMAGKSCESISSPPGRPRSAMVNVHEHTSGKSASPWPALPAVHGLVNDLNIADACRQERMPFRNHRMVVTSNSLISFSS